MTGQTLEPVTTTGAPMPSLYPNMAYGPSFPGQQDIAHLPVSG